MSGSSPRAFATASARSCPGIASGTGLSTSGRPVPTRHVETGVWEISGEVYNADDPTDILGGFKAVIKESVWKNKPHYVMVRLSAEAQ